MGRQVAHKPQHSARQCVRGVLGSPLPPPPAAAVEPQEEGVEALCLAGTRPGCAAAAAGVHAAAQEHRGEW